MLGRICSNNTINAYNKPCTEKQQDKLDKISDRLKKYFHEITNPHDQEWESQSYEQNQKLPSSAY